MYFLLLNPRTYHYPHTIILNYYPLFYSRFFRDLLRRSGFWILTKKPPPTIKLYGAWSLNKKGSPGFSLRNRLLPPGCQKFTSSIPGCCEEKCKPIIIRDAGGAPRVSPWFSAVGIKPFISYHPCRLITILLKV